MNRVNRVLLEEYKNAVQLYCHEDNLKQTRMNYLYIIQGAGIAALKAFYDNFFIKVAICLLEIIITFFICLILARHRKFLIFRTAQAMDLEKRIGQLSTFEREYRLFARKKGKKHEKVIFAHGEEMQVKGFLAKFGAQRAESFLPWIFIAAWGFFLFYFILYN